MDNHIEVEAPEDMDINIPGEGIQSHKKGAKFKLSPAMAMYHINGGRVKATKDGKALMKEMNLQAREESQEAKTEFIGTRTIEDKGKGKE